MVNLTKSVKGKKLYRINLYHDNELKSANSAKIGKIFKEASNKLELSKNDIAEALVMNIKYIEAIESGNYSIFQAKALQEHILLNIRIFYL